MGNHSHSSEQVVEVHSQHHCNEEEGEEEGEGSCSNQLSEDHMPEHHKVGSDSLRMEVVHNHQVVGLVAAHQQEKVVVQDASTSADDNQEKWDGGGDGDDAPGT